MKHLKQTASRYLSTILIVAASCQVSAFEQGTYFIYQLVEQGETQPVEKRLTVDSKRFTPKQKAQAQTTSKADERSEFEMDYNSLGTTSTSGFNSTSTEVQTTVDTSTFNLTPTETISLFGN